MPTAVGWVRLLYLIRLILLNAMKKLPWLSSLKVLGYNTAMTGKWHLGGEEQSQPVNQGFDELESWRRGKL